jgi:hypothetical protein
MRRLGRCTGLCPLVFALACSVYDASLIDGRVAGLPARPAANTSSPDDSESLLFALNEIFLRQSAEIAAGVGIDLDSTLTTGPNDATCEPPTIDGEVVGQAVVDGEKGIDNAIGALLLPTVGTALPCLEDNLALTQGRGIGTVLLWVRGWNGLDHDASVSVVLTNAVDATSEDPSLVGFADSDPVNLVYLGQRETLEAPPPRWDNQDYWYLDPADFDADESGRPSLDLPKEPQLDAYVSYSRLVVLLRPGTAFELIAGDGSLPSDGDMTIAVNGGYLMGDIDEERTRLARGLFAGRLTLEKLTQITPKVGLCAFDAELMQSLIGKFADIVGFPANDGTGMECDAFSVGVTFKAVVGEVAGLAASSRPVLEPCAQTGPIPVDRCCPSEWSNGKTRAETCDTFEKLIKAARFDSLSNAIRVPVPEPELL